MRKGYWGMGVFSRADFFVIVCLSAGLGFSLYGFFDAPVVINSCRVWNNTELSSGVGSFGREYSVMANRTDIVFFNNSFGVFELPSDKRYHLVLTDGKSMMPTIKNGAKIIYYDYNNFGTVLNR